MKATTSIRLKAAMLGLSATLLFVAASRAQQEVDPWIPEQQAVPVAENQPAAAVIRPLPPAQAPAVVRLAGTTRERAFRIGYLGMIMLDEEGTLANLAPGARRLAKAAGRLVMLAAKVEGGFNGLVFAQ